MRSKFVQQSERTSAEIRAHLLDKIVEWEKEIPPDGAFMGTFGAGVALRAVSLVGTLIRRVVLVLLPEAELTERPTLGFYVHTIERYGRDHEMTCVEAPRRLITSPEVKLLSRLSRMRAVLAHQEEAWASDVSAIGELRPSEVRELLDAVRAVIRLPMFDELICRETSAEPPTP